MPPQQQVLEDPEDSQVIHADLLIPGPSASPPQRDHSVVLQGRQITWLGPTSSLPDAFHKLPAIRVPVLLPGLWDAHVHLMGLTTFNFRQILDVPDAVKGLRLARNCYDLLRSGFTSVRDLGGLGTEIGWCLSPSPISLFLLESFSFLF